MVADFSVKKQTREKYVRICPVCDSTDVSPDFSIPAAIAAGALYSYRCNRCDFVGIIFPEVLLEEIPPLRNLKEIKRSYPIVDVTYGRGYAGLLRFISPFGLILSLLIYANDQQWYNLAMVIVFSYLTLYIAGRRYFDKHRILRIASAIVIILYTLFFRII